ncbi:RTA1 protein [Pyrenophora tritici-repentis]|uniref:RTA1 protein n=1 Tax=Pyrenophora tritici-repentis TaxID=45151 RepID=A0A922SRN6_9PLEO|nr:RTA1 protein [Pyrenophora tritici-repentis]KAI1682512.1 RTA1 protein [Pyrenophora tritici-repentis]
MYRYTPSLAAAILCVVAFGILAIVHLALYVKGSNRVVGLVFVGAVCETAGYTARTFSHYNNTAWGPFIVQGVLTLVGPLWFAAGIYVVFGRVMVVAGGGKSVGFVGPRWCTRVFVGADVLTLIVQGLGSSIMGTMQLSLAIAGSKIVIAGLALQVATFLVFLTAALDFQWRMLRKQTTSASTVEKGPPVWRKTLYVLYGVSTLILLRCVFRLVEYSMGNAAYAMAHEWTLYCFDALPMVAVLVVLAVLRPERCLEGDVVMVEEKGDGDSDGEIRVVEGVV